jgi:hypothetical protein
VDDLLRAAADDVTGNVMITSLPFDTVHHRTTEAPTSCCLRPVNMTP